MYVCLEDGRVGELLKTNSHNKEGKYTVMVKGDTTPTHHHSVQETPKTVYDNYKPAKQPAKRGSKKNV